MRARTSEAVDTSFWLCFCGETVISQVQGRGDKASFFGLRANLPELSHNWDSDCDLDLEHHFGFHPTSSLLELN